MTSFTATRVAITADPFDDASLSWEKRGRWPADWVGQSAVHDNQSCVVAYRLRFSLGEAATVRVHLSADERYRLFVDGRPIGRGPERCDVPSWAYESYDLWLEAGAHVIVAQTWWLGAAGPAPLAQMSARPGFLFAAEGVDPALLNTGKAAWECKRLGGYEWRPHGDAWGCGAKVRVVGARADWGFESGGGEGWGPVVTVGRAAAAEHANDFPPIWRLRPARLPAMVEVPATGATVRHVSDVLSTPERPVPVRAGDRLAGEQPAWDALLAGAGRVSVPANGRRRVIIDAGRYVCAYPRLVVTGGRGAAVRLYWAESLVDRLPSKHDWIGHTPKGDRAQVEGKYFWGHPHGVGDEFLPDGGRDRMFETLWWEAGRFAELTIEAADEPLTLESVALVETHYPHAFESAFESDDARLARVVPLALRTLEMCSHETYMDCPYYEQLQYIGDTRLQVLVTYVTTRDDRLPRQAIDAFDGSRSPSGLTQSRYPSRVFQSIPTFSLWWVGMVHDFAMWRDDRAFVRGKLPGVRAVLDAYAQHLGADGTLAELPGWNYVDWVPGWSSGAPAGTGVVCWQFVNALAQAADLEDHVGEPELAALRRRQAARLAAAATAKFFDEARGLLADDAAHAGYSEHSQALAVLSGLLPPHVSDRVADGLLRAPDLARATIYFSHYLFEALCRLDRTDVLIDRLGLWFDLADRGLTTTVEMPEPTRSDCHAWGAHPVFHYHASLLGVRPSACGFSAVRIEPRLGPLGWARGTMTHPRGAIAVDVRRIDGRLTGTVTLPAGVIGEFVAAPGDVRALRAGTQHV